MLMHRAARFGRPYEFPDSVLVVLLAVPSWAAEKARLRVDDYQIEAELEPHLHQITARAKVKFTALQDLNVAVFELHNDLRVTRGSRREEPASVAPSALRRIRPCACRFPRACRRTLP